MKRQSTKEEHLVAYTESVRVSEKIKLTPEDLTRDKLIELVLQPINLALNGEAEIALPEYLRAMKMLAELKGYDKEEEVTLDKSLRCGSYTRTRRIPKKPVNQMSQKELLKALDKLEKQYGKHTFGDEPED